MKDIEKNLEILNQAAECIQNEEFGIAKELLEKIIADDPENIEAYKNLGLCEVNLDSPPDAINAFEKVLESNQDDASSLFYLACCKARIGDKEEAAKLFEKIIALRPNHIDSYNNLAMIYIEFQQVDDAVKLLKSALDNSEIIPDYSLYYILSTAYMLKKEYASASEFLLKALEVNPENVSVMNSLSTCYTNLNEYEKSFDILNKAYEINPKHSLTLFNLGVYYQNKGDFATALKYFQESYNIEPTISMLSSLAFCALNAHEYQLASTLYQNLVLAYPNNTSYRMSYIDALENIQNYDAALQNTNILLSTDEKNVSLIKKKGTLLRKLGKHDESVDVFQSLIKRAKIDVEVYYNLAFNFVELKDYDNAKEMFKKCIILEPNNPYAHKDLGVLYLKMNQYDWAVDELNEAIKLEDDVAEFYYSLGVAYMMLSRVDEAKEMFLKSEKLEPNDADNLAYLGYIYIIEKDFTKAYSTLQQAIKINPDSFLAKVHLAKYYYVEKKYEPAKQLLLDAINLTSDDETLNMLGVCCLETEDYASAIGIFHRLSLKYPSNHILLTNLAKCESKCNKKEEAKKHIQSALEIFNDYEPALNLLEELIK